MTLVDGSRWETFQEGFLASRILCKIGEHDWRYHLQEPRRMCRKCHTKQIKVDPFQRDPTTEGGGDDE